uniref:Uncharacterized protein n=1 Tax=Parascaris equorum TaxID=6256 RepID=A0A914S3H2_PAREQ
MWFISRNWQMQANLFTLLLQVSRSAKFERNSSKDEKLKGPTVASAPSVELEDYRTPKPVVSDIKNGKSFDFGGAGANALNASDNNALIKVRVYEKNKQTIFLF